MTRDDWLDQFIDEIVKLRPHLVGSKMARTLALQQYKPAEHPRDMARQYDKAQRSPADSPKKAPKRRA
jgi:hypothetical protein